MCGLRLSAKPNYLLVRFQFCLLLTDLTMFLKTDVANDA